MNYEDDEYEIDREFESKYDQIWGNSAEADEDYDRDVVTGRRNKRPKMSVLNKGKLSKQEMDELFLEY
jgi:hypothetical protein